MEKIIWSPQEKQRLFQAREEYEVLYGGAAGGGKSDALLTEALRKAGEVLAEEGKTPLYFARGGRLLGLIAVADVAKPDSAAAIRELHGLGTRVVLLTGDNARTAEAVGRTVGVAAVAAEGLPADKEAVVGRLAALGKTAMVGDGINDAPALTRADVGVAMGALGSDAAIESADIVLMDDKLAKLPAAIRLARRTMRIVRENIVFALAVKAVILVLGALGYANMWIAVFGDVGVTVIAVLNAMRALLRPKR